MDDLHAVARRGGILGAGDVGGVDHPDFGTRRVATGGCGGDHGRTVLVARSAAGAESLRIGRIARIREITGEGEAFAAHLEGAGRGHRGMEPDTLRLAVRILRAPAPERTAWLAVRSNHVRRDLARSRLAIPDLTVPRILDAIAIARVVLRGGAPRFEDGPDASGPSSNQDLPD